MAELLACKSCGSYMGAVMSEADGTYAVLNVR